MVVPLQFTPWDRLQLVHGALMRTITSWRKVTLSNKRLTSQLVRARSPVSCACYSRGPVLAGSLGAPCRLFTPLAMWGHPHLLASSWAAASTALCRPCPLIHPRTCHAVCLLNWSAGASALPPALGSVQQPGPVPVPCVWTSGMPIQATPLSTPGMAYSSIAGNW